MCLLKNQELRPSLTPSTHATPALRPHPLRSFCPPAWCVESHGPMGQWKLRSSCPCVVAPSSQCCASLSQQALALIIGEKLHGASNPRNASSAGEQVLIIHVFSSDIADAFKCYPPQFHNIFCFELRERGQQEQPRRHTV